MLFSYSLTPNNVFFLQLFATFSLFWWLITNVCYLLETADGKYISPFHDIPLIADSEQVTG